MSEQVVPKRTYYHVAIGLMLLLALTIGAAFVDLGELNVIVALTIAVAKMLLVVLYFMHVRYGPRLVWVFAAGGAIWFIILIMLTMSDFLTR